MTAKPSRRPTILAVIMTLAVLVTAGPGSSAASAERRAGVDRNVRRSIQRSGTASFWVLLRERADLGATHRIRDRKERGKYVIDRLRAVADREQAGVRGLLRREGAEFRSFWIVNAIKVRGDERLLDEIASRAEVKRIIADGAYQLPRPQSPAPGSVLEAEWNIERVKAPDVWSIFSVRGEDVVVATVDTGVEFTHSALVTQYRGNQGGDVFDHNYSWFDPSRVCGRPSLVPCDNVGHGTHVTGTMVGDDGNPGPNQIGVAPQAKWIAAKGCETNSCSFEALLASGEWILAPTDLNGQNARPDLRPHVVNNSWGGGPGDPFYADIVDAWVASGIFPQFANGNSGPDCGSSGSPGDYVASYSAGAFDISDKIAFFSSRGPSDFNGEIKPNIAAPGVDVRSSVPGNGYEFFSGTSMASPHVAGVVALMWSAAPALVGDIAATRAILDEGAIDTSDLSCGGTAADNNVWGEGRLNAFAAVDLSPRGPTGMLEGVVTDAVTSDPIGGARVSAVGAVTRRRSTDDAGAYSFRLPIGAYTVETRAFGYLTATALVQVLEDQTTVQEFALELAPRHAVSGAVRDHLLRPIEGARVRILDTPLEPVITDADGTYRFPAVPEGEYDVRAEADRCREAQTQPLVVDLDETLDFALPLRSDTYGYFCVVEDADYIEAGTVLPITGNDRAASVALPFPFTLYGRTYSTAYVSTNGFMTFSRREIHAQNEAIPTPAAPNAAIYAFWDDLIVDDQASIRSEVLGEAPRRRLVIEWRNVGFSEPERESEAVPRVDFEVVLYENGQVLTQYRNIGENEMERAGSATIGIENDAGTDALQHSFDEPVIGTPTFAVRYRVPPSAFVQGHVTDAVDGFPITGATVSGVQAGAVFRTVTTNPDGFYRLQLPLGTYAVEAGLDFYETSSIDETLDVEDAIVTRDFALRSARAALQPGALEILLPPGQVRTKTLRLGNRGQLDLEFSIGEIPVRAAAGANAAALDANSAEAPSGYTARSPAAVKQGGSVLVFMDALPWESDALLRILAENGIGFDTARSSEMDTIDLSAYEVVFLSNDQPQAFYDAYTAHRARFDDYVSSGGYLWVGAAAWGWNNGDFDGGVLPGGVTVVGPVLEEFNDVLDEDHPTVQGVPDPFSGSFASHAAFADLPAEANVIAAGVDSGEATLVEYPVGAGRVLAIGQTMEFAFEFGQDAGIILQNAVPYAFAFEPILDVPWLSADPASGIVAAGGEQAIQVTVDTTGLASGVYKARLLLLTNDPRNTRLPLPVTLIVPAYRQGVNVASETVTDKEGDPWDADRLYSIGSYGYTNSRSSTGSTRRDIAGTEDDPLYTTQRNNPLEYRFDGLPSGVYQVELRFAELRKTQPNTRLFDVIIEGSLILPAHDIAAEVGSFAADDHVFFVPVTDTQLNVRFVGRRGYAVPIINAVRVTHRPDR